MHTRRLRINHWMGAILLVLFWSLLSLTVYGAEVPGKDYGTPFFQDASRALIQVFIAVLTPAIVFFIGKVRRVPRPLLPTITPVLGILIGLALQKLGTLHLTWLDMGGAGAAGVAVREIVNQWVTQRMALPDDDADKDSIPPQQQVEPSQPTNPHP